MTRKLPHSAGEVKRGSGRGRMKVKWATIVLQREKRDWAGKVGNAGTGVTGDDGSSSEKTRRQIQIDRFSSSLIQGYYKAVLQC